MTISALTTSGSIKEARFPLRRKHPVRPVAASEHPSDLKGRQPENGKPAEQVAEFRYGRQEGRSKPHSGISGSVLEAENARNIRSGVRLNDETITGQPRGNSRAANQEVNHAASFRSARAGNRASGAERLQARYILKPHGTCDASAGEVGQRNVQNTLRSGIRVIDLDDEVEQAVGLFVNGFVIGASNATGPLDGRVWLDARRCQNTGADELRIGYRCDRIGRNRSRIIQDRRELRLRFRYRH